MGDILEYTGKPYTDEEIALARRLDPIMWIVPDGVTQPSLRAARDQLRAAREFGKRILAEQSNG